jgi:exodeoxyribonuclease VII large subunit
LSKRLAALSPFQVLARGYAVVTRASDGKVIRSQAQTNAGDPIHVRVSDGEFNATVAKR